MVSALRPSSEAFGEHSVNVARIEVGDVDEDTAADRLGRTIAGKGARLSKATTGRVNQFADLLGVVDVDAELLLRLNYLQGVTLATLPMHAIVAKGSIMAILKDIPYALPEEVVLRAESLADMPMIYLKPVLPKRVGLVLSGSPAVEARVTCSFEPALATRVGQLNATIELVDYVPSLSRSSLVV